MSRIQISIFKTTSQMKKADHLAMTDLDLKAILAALQLGHAQNKNPSG
jgi:hypothetical protein